MAKAISDIKKSRGRPKSDTSPLMVRVAARDLSALDDALADEPDKPSRPEMVRRILRDWLIGAGYLKAGEESDGNGR
ncbi:hypothetical protein [Oricola indica]|uniref:hypothetical protein n=1 Tax=Oricola indica TaxID=2872591 RepID=UPI003CCC29AB